VIVLSLQAPAQGRDRGIERYMRVALPDDASDSDVRKALARLVADWRGRGDGSTLLDWSEGKKRWRKKARSQAAEDVEA